MGEDVKGDQQREKYLGHSLFAPVGRWQKGRDLQWFSKERKGMASDDVTRELEAVKAREKMALAEALGIGSDAWRQGQTGGSLEKHEIAEVLHGEEEEEDTADAD